MKKVLYILIQLTWGFIQSLLGFVVFLFFIRNKHKFYHGSIATEWNRMDGLSLGLFIFIPKNIHYIKKQYIYRHEFGHTIQSLLLGPLYLPLIGIPSLAWSRLPKYQMKRNRNHIDYYDFYTEKLANILAKSIKDDEIV